MTAVPMHIATSKVSGPQVEAQVGVCMAGHPDAHSQAQTIPIYLPAASFTYNSLQHHHANWITTYQRRCRLCDDARPKQTTVTFMYRLQNPHKQTDPDNFLLHPLLQSQGGLFAKR